MVEVDVEQAELLGVARFPFEAVHQAPCDVAFDVASVVDSAENGREI